MEITDDVIQWNADEQMTIVADNGITPDNTVYSGRLFQWNPQKYNDCCKRIWGNEGQTFYDRDFEDIENFLKLYLSAADLTLCRVWQGNNQSNGYPLWRFDYILQ